MRSRAQPPLLAFVGISLLLASVSCTAFRDWKLDWKIDRAAARFHEHLKASRFEDIYKEASADLQERETLEGFANKLRDFRSRLGGIVSVEKSPFSIRQEDERYQFVVDDSFIVKGTNEGCSELFFWDVSGAEPKLSRYSVIFEKGKGSINLTP